MSEGFCLDCGTEIESFEGLSACPFCGTTGSPASHKEQVNVSINWFELRILCIWAERWANEKNIDVHTVYGIAHRLEKQFPNMTKLTLAGEISDLKRDFPDLETNIPGVE